MSKKIASMSKPEQSSPKAEEMNRPERRAQVKVPRHERPRGDVADPWVVHVGQGEPVDPNAKLADDPAVGRDGRQTSGPAELQ
jgi:hypothetical protein